MAKEKKKLSTVQTYALRAARQAASRANAETQKLMSEVAKEVGIDITSNELWRLNDESTEFAYAGEQPTKDEKDES